MTAAAVSRGSRRFVAAGAAFLVAWRLAALAGAGVRVVVLLAVPGFVLHTVFGKGYSLVPTYFDRQLATPRAPALQLPLSVAGTVAMAVAAWRDAPAPVADVAAASVAGVGLAALGAALWCAGVAVFVGTLAWTVRDNPTGAATGTGDHNAFRRWTDRAANAAVPVALVYLLVGSYALLAAATVLPSPVDGYPPRATHLLAAGAAGLFVFAVGFRLLPRFLVARPPRSLVAVVLPAGAVGPALLAAGIKGGPALHAGAALEATAVGGFAVAYLVLAVTSERSRVGLYGVLLGALSGAVAVALGLTFAVGTADPALVAAHRRLNLAGFLGLTVVGVAYQFYPPAAGRFRGAGDRTAWVSLGALAGGLWLAAAGLALDMPAVTTAGDAVALAGSVLYAFLLFGLFRQRG